MSAFETITTKSALKSQLTPALSLIGSNFKSNTAKSTTASRNNGPFKNSLNNSPIRPSVRTINEMQLVDTKRYQTYR